MSVYTCACECACVSGEECPQTHRVCPCVPVLAVGASDSSANAVAPRHPHPRGKASWESELKWGSRRARGWGPGLTARSAPGSMPATPNVSCVLCCPQYGATLQPWRLNPCNPRGQHGQQPRQPPSQGQGVQPAPQPSAHRELTACPSGPSCLPSLQRQKRGQTHRKGTFSCPCPEERLGLGPGLSWPFSPAQTPGTERLLRCPKPSWRLRPMTLVGVGLEGGAGANQGPHLLCVLKPNSFCL